MIYSNYYQQDMFMLKPDDVLKKQKLHVRSYISLGSLDSHEVSFF